MRDIRDALGEAFSALAARESVRAIGVSGGSWALPEPGEGDVDVFVYCAKRPSEAERAGVYPWEGVTVGLFDGALWGAGDRAVVSGVEAFFMYFTREEAAEDARSILECERGVKEGAFYPTGRLGMYAGMLAAYDPDGFLAELRTTVAAYPDALARQQIGWALDRLSDMEGIDRCAVRRDITGYHAFLDEQIEAAFIALFAKNRAYYPSRKRNMALARGFDFLPEAFEARLREVIALGAREEDIPQSRAAWSALAEDVRRLL